MFIEELVYQQILKVMPISCIDLVVEDEYENILMLKRKNEPAKNMWWFPGGRIFYGETRELAVKRKLLEECGLVGEIMNEIGTYDVFLNYNTKANENCLSHGISTFYKIKCVNTNTIVIDSQSSSFKWKPRTEWIKEINNPVLIKVLTKSLIK